jgi:peroxiredoxin
MPSDTVETNTPIPDVYALPSDLPVPADDGACAHLAGMPLPQLPLPSTAGGPVDLSQVAGRVVVFAYPRTGVPGQPSLVDDWDLIPGARGCTTQTRAFRDHHEELRALGVAAVFGLSTQDTAYQREHAERLALPFPILSDDRLYLTEALRLPTFSAANIILLKRLALVIDDGVITNVFYPVFPPNQNAEDVIAWLLDDQAKIGESDA